MTFLERLSLCNKFDEGTEVTDFIQGLVRAADLTGRYGSKYDAEVVLSIVERNIVEYIDWVFREGEYRDYTQLDDEIFKVYHGGEKTLTEDQFSNNWHRLS